MTLGAMMDSPVITADEIVYPESDGKPMADNTKQYEDIITIQVGLDSLFAGDPNVFVAADLLWYPVEGRPGICTAPDTMVILGRPKGHRRSYKQWEEAGVGPQVVFEILSHGNRSAELDDKRRFYERYGVEEYIEYDPEKGTLEIQQRNGHRLEKIVHAGEWRSPLLGILLRLEADGELSVFHPDGRKFMRPVDLDLRVREAEARIERERERAEQERERADLLAARLRELGIDPESLI